jgi:hypothetical protein
MFKKFALSKGEELVNTIALDIRITGIRNAVLFQPKDFSSPCITDKDIQFILRLNEDTSDWQCILDKTDRRTYLSKTNYSIGGVRGLQLGKIVGYLPCSVDQAFELEMFLDARHMFDPNQKESLGHEVIFAGDNNNFPYSTDTYRYTMNIGSLLQRRVFDMISTFGMDTERQCYFNIGKTSSVYRDILPESEKKKYMQGEMIYGYTFYRISDNLTRYVHVFYVNLKLPSISDILYKDIALQRCRAHHKGYMKILKEGLDESLKRESGVRLIFEDFKKRYLPGPDSKKTWQVETVLQ